MPGWALPVALVVALVAAFATGTLAFTQRQEIQRLRADLDEAETRVAELEAERDEGEHSGGLEGLLDGTDGLGDLFGDADGADLAACLAGGDPQGLVGGGEPIVADDLTTQIQAIAERVEGLRGLEFRDPVEPQLLPTAEFTALITELAGEDYTAEDADLDGRVLTALGAVEPGVDLRTLVMDLIGEQAAGFYEPDTGQLVVRADDADALLAPGSQVILAHELEHALTDQHLPLPVDAEAPADGDGETAALALVEGGATLLMQRFAMDALGPMEQLSMATDPSVAGSQEQLEGYPQHLQRELTFPYTDGLGFVCAVHADGGWPAVDAAYDDLPSTTAQILWPDRYAAGEDAVAVDGLGTPGEGWTKEHTDTFGAAQLLWLFSAPGDDPGAALDAPREHAAAWAGGQLELWTDGATSAVGIVLAERAGERDLCDSVTAWYRAAFPDALAADTAGEESLAVDGQNQDAVVVCAGGTVRVGIAPDLAAARGVAR